MTDDRRHAGKKEFKTSAPAGHSQKSISKAFEIKEGRRKARDAFIGGGGRVMERTIEDGKVQ